MLAIITGGNRGIGLELCRQLLAQGWDVIVLCREASQDLMETGARFVEGVDIRHVARLKEVVENLKLSRVDLLINNAGILKRETIDALNYEAIQEQFEVNALGALRVTEVFLKLLTAGSKIALITSRMGSISDNTSGSRYGYRMSKAALNMAGVSLAHDLRDRGISVAILHPGYVRTDMTAHQGLIDPDAAAAGLIQRIEALSLTNSGTFWHSNGEVLPW